VKLVLAATAQGFPELLRGRGERVDGRVLRTMVPVLVRAEHERGVYNNRVSGVSVDLPVGWRTRWPGWPGSAGRWTGSSPGTGDAGTGDAGSGRGSSGGGSSGDGRAGD
jgi:hypothetical protein